MTNGNNKIFGDSIAISHNVTVPANAWDQVMVLKNNYGHNGDQYADMSNVIHGTSFPAGSPVTPSAYTTYQFMVGTNEQVVYKNDSGKQAYSKKFLRACVAWFALPTKVLGRDTGMSLTGTWVNTPVNSFGIYSITNNSTATATVIGSAVYIGLTLQNYTNTDSTAEIRIDGNLVGTLTSNASSPAMDTFNGATFATGAVCYSDLTFGSHTVEVKITSANGKYFYLDYIAGNNQARTPKILLSNVIKLAAADYTSIGITSSTTDTYNGIVNDIITECATNGLYVSLVDNHASINPLTDLQSDGEHPNDAGYAKIAANFQIGVNS